MCTEFYKACTMLLSWLPGIKGVGSLLNLDAILGKVEVATTCSIPPCCPSIGKGVVG